MTKLRLSGFVFVCAFGLGACGGSSDAPSDIDADGIVDTADNCAEIANPEQLDSDADMIGDACEATYSFVDSVGDSTVSYTGQTARLVLIDELVGSMNALQRGDDRTAQTIIEQDLELFLLNRDEATDTDNALDSQSVGFSLTANGDLNGDGAADVSLALDPTDASLDNLGAISTRKNLIGKIAGNDKCFHILVDGDAAASCDDGMRGEFFGWELGLNSDPLVRTPADLIDFYFAQMAEQAVLGELVTIATLENDATVISKPTLNNLGHDFRQLTQKFLLGAVTFSQGTADYLQFDYTSAQAFEIEDGKNYTTGQHDWDEAFGYYGAARNAASYTDLEARGASGRDAFKYGYNDLNNDNLIDIRSEIMLGHSTNCAKRDVGATNETTFTQDVFDAFVTGRQILQEAGDIGELTDAQNTVLQAEIVKASLTWEKCIAATVVHYINDVIADIDNYSEAKFVDLAHYEDLSKHWSEMKGFALGLQFNPNSPFRTDSSASTIADLKIALELMGDAPVLADGSQLGNNFEGGAAAYVADLLLARDIFEAAYEFDSENVANW